jgi:hypothetical protein
LRAGSNEELSKALESRNWKGLAAKIGLAVVGFSLMTIGIMVFFGSPTGVLLVLAGVLTVALGIFGDGIALVAQARKGEFTKHDWKYIYTTFFLSLASFVGVVALTIATGGIGALAVSLVLSSLWLCVNTLNAYRVWRYENRRWEVQSVIDLVTYRKFLETKPSQEKILEVKQKLSRKDLRYVKRLGDDVLRRLRAKEAQAEGLRRGQLGELVSKIESIL